MKNKSEVLEHVKKYKTEAENQTLKKIQLIISDGGGEFNSHDFKSFCAESGILHHFSSTYTPQNSGMAERANKIITEKARCMINQSKLPNEFWAEAINTATDISNILPSGSRNFSIPYELWHKKKFNYDTLKPFGCLVHCSKPKQFRNSKLAPTVEKGIFLGYLNDFSTYKIVNMNGTLMTTRETKFKENEFPGLNKNILKINENDDPFKIEIKNQEEKLNTNEVRKEHNNESDTESEGINNEIENNERILIRNEQNNNNPQRQEIAIKNRSSEINTENISNYDRRRNQIYHNLPDGNQCR